MKKAVEEIAAKRVIKVRQQLKIYHEKSEAAVRLTSGVFIKGEKLIDFDEGYKARKSRAASHVHEALIHKSKQMEVDTSLDNPHTGSPSGGAS
jgi:hypothetical protein